MGKDGERAAEEGTGGRRVVYCLIPFELAAKLHDPLRRHFREDSEVEVVVEHRRSDRRAARERRARAGRLCESGAVERRRVRAPGGRRVGERRALLADVEARPLPRRARVHAERIRFVERVEPSTEAAEDMDSARLVASFQAGDRDAFTLLYTRYFDRVYGYLRSIVRDRHEAEDITQQVFLQVLEALPRYERRSRPFRAWLFTVVRNRAIDHVRKQGRVEVEDADSIDRRRESEHEEPHHGFDWISDRDLLLFIERLPLAQRQVVVMRFVLDLSHAEIAAVMGRSCTDVRSLQHRALRYLRSRLGAVSTGSHRRRSQMRVYRRQAPVLRMRRFALLP